MKAYDIAYYITHYSYVGFFICFFLLDQITPIPEGLAPLTVGYISHAEHVNPFFAGLAALLGLMAINNTYFYLTVQGNKWVEKLSKKKRGQLLKKFRNKLQKHPVRTLFIIAYIPKIRFLMPIIVGLNKITYKKYFSYKYQYFIYICCLLFKFRPPFLQYDEAYFKKSKYLGIPCFWCIHINYNNRN